MKKGLKIGLIIAGVAGAHTLINAVARKEQKRMFNAVADHIHAQAGKLLEEVIRLTEQTKYLNENGILKEIDEQGAETYAKVIKTHFNMCNDYLEQYEMHADSIDEKQNALLGANNCIGTINNFIKSWKKLLDKYEHCEG